MHHLTKITNTLNYLKSNKIKYFKVFNYIISFPTTSPQMDFLYFNNTKEISFHNHFKATHKYTLILITKY